MMLYRSKTLLQVKGLGRWTSSEPTDCAGLLGVASGAFAGGFAFLGESDEEDIE